MKHVDLRFVKKKKDDHDHGDTAPLDEGPGAPPPPVFCETRLDELRIMAERSLRRLRGLRAASLI